MPNINVNVGKYIYYLYGIVYESDNFKLIQTFDTKAEAEAFANLHSPGKGPPDDYWQIRIHQRLRCLEVPAPLYENTDKVLIVDQDQYLNCVQPHQLGIN